MTSKQGKRRKINIDVKLERNLTRSSCIKIIEDLLKYILYQRRQIPLQYDLLVREVAKEEHLATSATEQEKNESQVYSRKEEIVRQNLERKRQRWLRKVKNFIENFKAVMQRLRTEFEEGDVVAVNISLGCSILSSRELFNISLPHNYKTVRELESLDGRHNTMQFFRTLITNEDLLNLVNRPCGIQKVWVMLQKHSPSTFKTFSTLQNRTISSIPDIITSGLVPRPGYAPNSCAQIIHINVHNPPQVGNSMDLTPCVGSGIIQCSSPSSRKTAAKRSLGFDLSSVSKRYSFSSDINSHSNLHCKSDSSDGGNRLSTSEKSVETLNGIQTHNQNFHDGPCLSNQRSVYRRQGLETPTNHSKGIAPVIQTPISSSFTVDNQSTPSKLLTTQLGNFTLSDSCQDNSDTCDNAMWYQIDHAICGFKDVCLK
ncbi:uncharacterized protein [Panulirus ornatus]|uniref:uncharacterized protein n=1 Tax=Panulirus ornatus TaxID=150431 RepID=UPI003A85DC35